jgi:lipopolysaccharide export LptBFGC system permease protein LptF
MLATLGMTVFVFTLVLLLGNVIKKELLQLVVNRQANFGLVLHAILLLIPYVLAFSLPIGMLTAALLVFGRFSADQELTAARASGISLISLITPVLLLSVAVSGLCAWLNIDVAPACRTAYNELLYRAGLERPANLLQSGESVPFGDNAIWVGKVHADGTNLDNVFVSKYDTNGQLEEWITGTTGTIIPDLPHQKVILNLQHQSGMHHYSDGWKTIPDDVNAIFEIKVEPQAQKALPPPISDMTFRQLLEQREEIERSMSQSATKGKSHEELQQTQWRLKMMSHDMMTEVLVYMHREAAFSFACIGFTLVGIPLGIRGHRRETSAGVAMALVLMLIYYSFIVLGQAWADHPERAPYLIVWLPNFIFQAVGAVLLWRANRGL